MLKNRSGQFVSEIFIYGIIDPRNGSVCYVGKSGIGKARWDIHIRDLKRGKHHNSRLQRLHDKLVREKLGVFRFVVLEYCEDLEKASVSEVRLIARMRSAGLDLCNLTEGGGLCGYRHTEETKKKISEKKKGEPNVFSREGMISFLKKQKARIPTRSQLESLRRGREDPEIVERMKQGVREGSKKRVGISLSSDHRQAMKEAKKRPGSRACGENQGLSKLTDFKVLEIRKQWKTRDASTAKAPFVRLLAEQYGVSPTTIYGVVRDVTWRHLSLVGDSNAS